MHTCLFATKCFETTKWPKAIYALSSTEKFQMMDNSVKYVVMMIKNVNFITFKIGVVMLGYGHIGNIVKIHN